MDYYLESNKLRVKSTKVSKADCLDSLILNRNSELLYLPYDFNVDIIVRMDEDDFYDFADNLLDDWEFINEINQETDKPFIVAIDGGDLVNLIYPESLLVFSEGYSYARYSGIIEKIN